MSRRTALLLVALALAGCGPAAHPHVESFLRDPTAFRLDVEGSTGLGDVLGATLDGDSLRITYAYPGPEGGRRGALAGVLTEAELVGTYDTRGPEARFEGPLRLSFQPDGSATGVWNDGEGTVALVAPR